MAKRGRPPKSSLPDPLTGQPTAAAQEQDEVKHWTTRIERARKLREDWEQEYDVEKGERFFLGKQFAPVAEQTSVYNHFRATIRTIQPSLFLENPKFFVRPKAGLQQPTNELKAAQGESLLETVATQDDHLVEAVSLAVQQAFFRMGVLKVVYDPREVPNPRAGEPILTTGPDGEPVLGDDGLPIPLTTLDGQLLTEPRTVIADEVYRWEWVDARNLLLPDAGPNWRKWPWIGEEVTVPLEEAQQDPRFPASKRTQLRANITTKAMKDRRQTRETAGRSEMDEVDPMLQYIEVFDIRARHHRIWVEGQEELGFLVNDGLPEGIEDHPYSLLAFQPIQAPDPSPWPYPETHDWVPIQEDYNLMRKMEVEGARRAARKYGYDEGTFASEDEAVKATSAEDGVFFKVNDLNKMPRPLDNPTVTPDAWRNIPILQSDWRIVTGQTGARIQNPDSDSATEAIFAERAANLRDAELQKLVNRWLSRAGRKMFQLIKGTLTLGMYIKITTLADSDLQAYLQRVFNLGPDQLQGFPGLVESVKQQIGALKWQEVTREDLTFEADVSVAPGSTKPRNLDQERKQWLEFLAILGQAPQLAMSRELLRETASKFEHINDRMIDELVALAQQMNQIQMEKAGRTQGGGDNLAGNGQIPANVQALAQSVGSGL